MEETIRKIMDDELMGDAGDSERCAEKITTLFDGFMEWIKMEADIGNFEWDLGDGKEYSNSELFTYYKENILNK